MKSVLALVMGCMGMVFGAGVKAGVIAMQDFETVPAAPVWGFTGTPAGFESGLSDGFSHPANSPLGIGASRAWHVVSQSGGNPLTFDNVSIPSGFDSVVATFRLAAMNLTGSGGGPDNLDFVLVAYSLDGGSNFVDRVRVRGSTENQSTWAYDATGVAAVNYLPATEEVFQPTTRGLQTEFGYSTVSIEFPGSITQLSLRITPRSSSSSDSWLIDNLQLIGVGGAEVPEPASALAIAAGCVALLRRRAAGRGCW